MKRNKSVGRKLPCFIILSLAALLSGCTFGQADPNEIYSNAVASMKEKESFAFSGKTNVLTAGIENNIVNFSGFVSDKNNVYMNLNIKAPETEEEQIEFYSDENLYVKEKGEPKWVKVDQQDGGVYRQEFENWSPLTNLQQVEEMKKTMTLVDSPENEEIYTVQMTMDPDELKEMISTEMKRNMQQQMEMHDLEKIRENLNMTDEEFANMKKEIETSMREAEKQLSEMLDELKVNGVYTMQVDRQTQVPISLNMDVDTRYSIEGQEMKEKTIVTLNFTDYGKAFEKPPIG